MKHETSTSLRQTIINTVLILGLNPLVMAVLWNNTNLFVEHGSWLKTVGLPILGIA